MEMVMEVAMLWAILLWVLEMTIQIRTMLRIVMHSPIPIILTDLTLLPEATPMFKVQIKIKTELVRVQTQILIVNS